MLGVTIVAVGEGTFLLKERVLRNHTSNVKHPLCKHSLDSVMNFHKHSMRLFYFLNLHNHNYFICLNKIIVSIFLFVS